MYWNCWFKFDCFGSVKARSGKQCPGLGSLQGFSSSISVYQNQMDLASAPTAGSAASGAVAGHTTAEDFTTSRARVSEEDTGVRSGEKDQPQPLVDVVHAQQEHQRQIAGETQPAIHHQVLVTDQSFHGSRPLQAPDLPQAQSPPQSQVLPQVSGQGRLLEGCQRLQSHQQVSGSSLAKNGTSTRSN